MRMSSGTMGLVGNGIEGGAFGGEGYNWEDKVRATDCPTVRQ